MLTRLHAAYVVAVIWLSRRRWPEGFSVWLRDRARRRKAAPVHRSATIPRDPWWTTTPPPSSTLPIR